MVTVYTLTYNEELMLPFMIDHYRERFPGCRIVVYDSGSTDATIMIAQRHGCEVRTFSHAGGFQEQRHVDIKNTCWKDAPTNWVLMCDVDELLDISEPELTQEEEWGTTIIRSEGYDMVNPGDSVDLAGMQYGARNPGQDKSYLFNKKYITDINYASGCHGCEPVGTILYSRKAYKLYHYCYINYDVTVERYRVFQKRMNHNDPQNAGFYSETPEQIREIYTEAWTQAVKVR